MPSPDRRRWPEVSLLSVAQTVALAVALTISSGCKETDFNHYVNPAPARSFAYSHTLKELRGNSTLDILWVIDNSGSMRAYQQNVARNTAQFMQTFSGQAGIQWKMGMISSDESDEPYLGLSPTPDFDSSTPNPVSVFQSAVGQLGVAGSGTEKFFTPVLNTLQNHPSFLRPHSILALIFVTDAIEQSPIDARRFLSELATLKGDIRDVIVYAALGAEDFGCAPSGEGLNYVGSAHEAVIKATHGKVYKACDPNFGNSLADLGQDLVQRVATPRMYLAARPRQGTLVIRYHGQVLPGGPKADGGFWVYDYDLNAVLFHDLAFAHGDTESVEVSYREDDGIDLPGFPGGTP